MAACISTSWVYLVSQKGDCLVFRIQKGTLEQTIHEFAMQSTSKSTSSSSATDDDGGGGGGDGVRPSVEVTQLIHHPFRSTIAAWSNDKTQKRGVLTVWK